jgi:hypothetical protein
MFTFPAAVGEAVAVDVGVPEGCAEAAAELGDLLVGVVAAWACPPEWLTFGRMSQ